MQTALAQKDYEEIGRYIRDKLPEWLSEMEQPFQRHPSESRFREHSIRVAEELKHQRDLLQQTLHQMDKRFDLLDKQISHQREEMTARFDLVDKRFEQVDKQIFQQREEMLSRFGQVDKQIFQQREEMLSRIGQVDKQIALQREEMNARFEKVDKQFALQREEMTARFSAVSNNFAEVNRRLDLFMKWSITTTITVGGIIVAAMKLL